MTNNPQQQIRSECRRQRAAKSVADRATASEKISRIVINSTWFQRSELIACYLPVADEVNTWGIIERAFSMKKRIFAPTLQKNHDMRFRELSASTTLEENNFGLSEPASGKFVNARSLDVVITPLVAFDSSHNRIGMGGGHFDRTFAFLKGRQHYFHPKLIGVAFDCQKVEQIPSNRWDIRLFDVISELS